MLDNPSVDALLIMLVSAGGIVYIAWFLWHFSRKQTTLEAQPEPAVITPIQSAAAGWYFPKPVYCTECGSFLDDGRCPICKGRIQAW